ncbi:MAG: proline--tRNA ligase [Desulfobacterales bacterium CG2_30_60_27]|nr:MAG: proline--tRNA ligase [Desulfobacterales bacterium CG2_30_60_27]
MRYSQLLLPTLKETPAEAEIASHQLLLRAGFIRKLTAGVYAYLPLGLRTLRKIEAIVRQEMNRAGAQELLLPMVQPADLWKESGRWEKYGPELLRFVDRHQRESCLGPTHEEVITDLVRMNVHSYKDLPLNLYQIQTKFRDEIRPRFGLMRGREFVMKDGYSFDASEAAAGVTYNKMKETYSRIFARCGLSCRAVEADTGTIGGNFSHEFMVLAATGEDTIVVCTACDYAANMEKAACPAPALTAAKPAPLELERIATPGKKTVDEVTTFLGITPDQLVKTMIYLADGKPVAALVRGDHEVQPVKLKNLMGAVDVELASEDTVRKVCGLAPGSLGPMGLTMPVVADHQVMAMANMVTGANQDGVHLKNVNQGRDFPVALAGDLRMATAADPCPHCHGRLELPRGIEVGHIFKLGTSYSEALQATFLDDQGKRQPFVMGCYGIGVSRCIAAAIEQNHDDNGIIFPLPIAPFQVILLSLSVKDAEVTKAADTLYEELMKRGIETLYDDRNERPGIKFKDADLIGIPLRVMVGKRFIEAGEVEIKHRGSGATEALPMAGAADALAAMLDRLMAGATKG